MPSHVAAVLEGEDAMSELSTGSVLTGDYVDEGEVARFGVIRDIY